MRENKIKKIWREGGRAVNGWLSVPSAVSAEIMAHQGWDSLTIDMQHGMVDEAAMIAMLMGVSAAGGETEPIVRVPWLREDAIMKALDAGASGVICPMINTPAEAARLASAVRYPPNGSRSFGPARSGLLHGKSYHAKADEFVLALAMIETEQAVGSAREILSVPGLDGVYVGPADLASSLGCEITFTPSAAPVMEAIDEVLAAARHCGVRAGIHTGSPEYAAKMLDKGFDLVTVQSDARLMAAGSQRILEMLAEKKSGHGAG